MKLRPIGMAAISALVLIATRAQAQDTPAAVTAPSATPAPAASSRDSGWNTKYGMIFQADNIFQNKDFLEGYGGIGFQLNLSPQRAVRLTVNVGRESNPITKTSDMISGVTIETVPNPTSTLDVDFSAQYIVRLTSAALAPYIGAGAGFSWNSTYRSGTAKDSLEPGGWTTKYDWSDRTAEVNAVGTLGVEWRVHSMLSLFAEYGLNVGLYRSVNNQDKTSTNNDPTVGSVSIDETKSTSSRWFTFDTALNQGGRLGVVAFF